MARTEYNKGIFLDGKSMLILISTTRSKTAKEISDECVIPLSTTYRKLRMLSQNNFVKIGGKITNGKRYFFFTNNAKIHRFRNPERALHLLNVILQNPGICFRDVVRITGITNGIVSHYLSRLQKIDLLKIKRRKRKIWLFASGLSNREMNLMVYLRTRTSFRILTSLLKEKLLKFSDLVARIGRCPASLSINLSKLIDDKIVNRAEGAHSSYHLVDHAFVAKTIAKIASGKALYVQ